MTLEILTYPLLAPTRHGFFTRKGGASSGLYSGLNCGRGSQDQCAAVQVNRDRVADALGVAPQALAGLHQCHSARVITLTDADEIAGTGAEKADALVTATPGIALSVLTADCQPVLFADPEAGVIGAAHAGWKGALAGVLGATAQAMRDLGAQNIRAVIGPAISMKAYEVGWDFYEDFIAHDPAYQRFFAGDPGAKPHFNLPGFGLHLLEQAGVRAEYCGHCTYSDEARFFSYRRATHRQEPDYGRLISAIAL